MKDTSLEAYDSLNESDCSVLRQKILALLRKNAMTAEQIYFELGGDKNYSASGANTRRKELEKLGLIEDSGRRGQTRRGNKCVIWQVTHQQQKLF